MRSLLASVTVSALAAAGANEKMNAKAAKIAASFIISPKGLRLVLRSYERGPAGPQGWRVRRPHFTRGRIEILRAKFGNREHTNPIDSGVDPGATVSALRGERASRPDAARTVGNCRVLGLRDGIYRQRAGLRRAGAGFRLGCRALEGSRAAEAQATGVCFPVARIKAAAAEYERADAVADVALGARWEVGGFRLRRRWISGAGEAAFPCDGDRAEPARRGDFALASFARGDSGGPGDGNGCDAAG